MSVLMAGLNREAWLTAMTEKLRPMFDDNQLYLPAELHISVGFPSKGGVSPKKRKIGQHWDGGASKDGKHHIFISPLLASVKEVGETLVHELLHAALPPGSKHGPLFKKGMVLLGLTGKPTATEAGHELEARLEDIAQQLGEYPHGGLTPAMLDKQKQTTRMRKLTCKTHPDYIIRASQKTIDLGLPVCGMCVLETLLDPPPLMQVELSVMEKVHAPLPDEDKDDQAA